VSCIEKITKVQGTTAFLRGNHYEIESSAKELFLIGVKAKIVRATGSVFIDHRCSIEKVYSEKDVTLSLKPDEMGYYLIGTEIDGKGQLKHQYQDPKSIEKIVFVEFELLGDMDISFLQSCSEVSLISSKVNKVIFPEGRNGIVYVDANTQIKGVINGKIERL
jgi:hypothetical protein